MKGDISESLGTMKRSELLSHSVIEWLEDIALDTVSVYACLLVSSLNDVCA